MSSLLKLAAKNSFIFGLGNASQRLVGFILIPLYTSHFSTADYGKIGLLEVSSTFLVTVLGMGLYRAFNRWYWDKQYINNQKSLFFSLLVTLVIIGISFFSLIFVFQSDISKLLFDSEKYTYVLHLMTLSAMLQIIAQLISDLLKLQQKPVLYSFSQIIKLLVSLVTTVLLIVKFNGNIEAIYKAQLLGLLVYFIILSKYVYDNSEFRLDKIILLDLFKYSYPLMLAAVSGIVFSIADRYLIKFLLGLGELGIYTLGYKIANSIRIFLINSIQMALTPIMYKMIDEENNTFIYAKIMTYFSIIVIFAVFIISIFSSDILKLISSKDDFREAASVVPILSFAIFFGMLKDVAGFGLHITKKTKIFAGIVLFISIINIIFNWILISIFGYHGAAYALLISQICFFILIYNKANKQYPIPYELSKIILLFSIAVFSVVLILVMDNYLFDISPLLKIVFTIIFALSLYWFKIIEIREVKLVVNIFSTRNNKVNEI